jgi:2-polyprenyl-6-hydroxyphenyl methylase/3-demethylubiquinone-9 3-methyltransferase
VLAAFGALWWTGHREVLAVQLAVTLGFLAYQVVYWNVVRARTRPVNNTWYADLGTRWYEASDTPIALLRAEARHRNPWIAREIAYLIGRARVDLGCGANVSNYLAEQGHRVTGLDMTEENLTVARSHDRTRSVVYQLGDARSLPYPDASFDVICAMDLLEHVEDPARVVAEAGRVLAPGGMFFFPFNRTRLANLIVIRAWSCSCFRRSSCVIELFVKPSG